MRWGEHRKREDNASKLELANRRIPSDKRRRTARSLTRQPEMGWQGMANAFLVSAGTSSPGAMRTNCITHVRAKPNIIADNVKPSLLFFCWSTWRTTDKRTVRQNESCRAETNDTTRPKGCGCRCNRTHGLSLGQMLSTKRRTAVPRRETFQRFKTFTRAADTDWPVRRRTVSGIRNAADATR